jgi:hypothetical protein
LSIDKGWLGEEKFTSCFKDLPGAEVTYFHVVTIVKQEVFRLEVTAQRVRNTSFTEGGRWRTDG